MTGQQCDQDATVYDATGETIGTLPAHDAQDGYLMVRKGTVFPKDLYIPVTTVQSTDAAGNVYLSLHNDDLAEARDDSPPVGATASDAQTATVAETTTTRAPTTPARAPTGRRPAKPAARTDDIIAVPVYEEDLVVGTRQEETGRVHLHKEVVQEQETVLVTLRREEVTVERVPVMGQARQTDRTDAFRSQDIEAPVMGEEAVVGTQVRETEEVRLHKDVTQEQEQVTDTVRKERVVIAGVDSTGTTGAISRHARRDRKKRRDGSRATPSGPSGWTRARRWVGGVGACGACTPPLRRLKGDDDE